MLSDSNIDANGMGVSKGCKWIAHKKEDHILLENQKFSGKYLAVSKDAKKVTVGTGGELSKLRIKKEKGERAKEEDKESTK